MSAKATGSVVGKDGCESDTFQGNETLIVQVEDTARMDAPSITLGAQKIALNKGSGFPINFAVEYDEEEANRVPDYGFTFRAVIEDNQGKMLYINDTRTSARSDKIEVKKIQ